MDAHERGQVSDGAASVYDEFFLPALFEAWAAPVANAAGIRAGQRVLDVACGTGVLARCAAGLVGESGTVVGLDPNASMLARARQRTPEIDWRAGVAEDLPFADGSFDAVVSQFGLMFFVDRPRALREMVRVLREGGHLAVAVWASLDRTPGYEAMVALLDRLFGRAVARSLEAPYALGDLGLLERTLEDAGLGDAHVETRAGSARFPSIESWIRTDIRGWTLAGALDDAQYRQLQAEAATVLRRFETPSGTVEFPSPAHLITWRRDTGHDGS